MTMTTEIESNLLRRFSQSRDAEDGLKLKGKATVRKGFSLAEGGTLKGWQEVDKFELEVRLKKVGEGWRIAGF